MKFRRGEKRLNMEKLYPSRQLPRSSYLRVTPFSSGGNSKRPSSSNHYSRSFKIMDFWSNYLAGGDGRCKRFLERILFLSPLVIATRETFPRDFIISTKVLPKFYGAGGREQRDEILSFPTPINFRFGNGFKLEYHTFDISWRMFQLSVHCFPLWIFWLMGSEGRGGDNFVMGIFPFYSDMKVTTVDRS